MPSLVLFEMEGRLIPLTLTEAGIKRCGFFFLNTKNKFISHSHDSLKWGCEWFLV